MKTTPLQILVFADKSDDLAHLLQNEPSNNLELEYVTNTHDGVAHLANGKKADLILLDLSVPGSQGLEALKQIHAQAPEVPTIVLTRHDDDDLALKAVQAGAQDFLVKGEFDRHLLVRAIRHSVERKKAEKERKRLETQMQYAQKLESLGVLAGGIAHDFNNLLMAIVARAGLALRSIGPDSPAYIHLKHIEKSGLRGGELANQMLTYAGKGKPIIQTVNVTQLIKEMAHLLRVSISKHAILNYELSTDLPPIEADPSQIRQLVMSVLTNASEAIGDDDGTITVTTGTIKTSPDHLKDWYVAGELPQKLCVYIDIRDTGSGMKPETIPKIFDPFFTTKFTGRGLGLAALLGIVRAHNGAVAVKSHLGEGTHVRLLLPSLRAQESESSAPTPADLDWKCTGTVLVVDDEEDVRIASQLILEEIGLTVLTAKDGFVGLEAYKQGKNEITLVLLDLTMPRMNGEQLFKEIRKINQKVPILLSSGYNEEEASKRFQGVGIYGFIQKPYQIDALIEKVRQTIESAD